MANTELHILNLEDLIDLHKRVTKILEEDYDYFNVISKAHRFGKSTPYGYIIYTDFYKNDVDLYKNTKKMLCRGRN